MVVAVEVSGVRDCIAHTKYSCPLLSRSNGQVDACSAKISSSTRRDAVMTNRAEENRRSWHPGLDPPLNESWAAMNDHIQVELRP
uniref:Uncharacterized protein n=1 Tax=Arundo donax TaxID=35708 RepID=A0A0A8YFD1_ARUDO